MALFKKFTGSARKAELEGFKARLKYGEDPKALYDASKEHYAKYRELKESTEDLLRRILKPKESDKYHNWSKMEIYEWDWQGTGKCNESPIKKHIYLHHYGDKNPHKDEPRKCICCGKEL